MGWTQERGKGRGTYQLAVCGVMAAVLCVLAPLSIPIMAPLGQFAAIPASLIITAFQSASGLVNIITPTAAVVMGGLAFGRVPYESWIKFVWKLILIFLLLTAAFLAISAVF